MSYWPQFFYLYSRVKRYFPILKMAEELISNLGYDAQSDTKCQKLLECILTGNSKLYLEPQKEPQGKATQAQ